jgi:hypothetical protein
MSRDTYSVGDTVILKADLTRKKTDARACRIVSILPADHGEAQYQVRFENESFERRIFDKDIAEAETRSPSRQNKTPISADGRWLKPLSIKVGK